MLGPDGYHMLTRNLLRSGVLILAVLGSSSSARAQALSLGTPSGATASLREHAPRATGGASTIEAGAATPGPRRAVSFSSASLPFQAEREVVEAQVRSRPSTTGALIGGVIGGAIGFAAGYQVDNIERSGGAKVGSATLISTAGGVLIGALVGGAVGWLVER